MDVFVFVCLVIVLGACAVKAIVIMTEAIVAHRMTRRRNHRLRWFVVERIDNVWLVVDVPDWDVFGNRSASVARDANGQVTIAFVRAISPERARVYACKMMIHPNCY